MTLTMNAQEALGDLCAAISVYNASLDKGMHPTQYTRLTTLIYDVKSAWKTVCDRACALKGLSGYDVVIGGDGPVWHGFIRAVKIQLIDKDDHVPLEITFSYELGIALPHCIFNNGGRG